MTDYSAMSDIEINANIASVLYGKLSRLYQLQIAYGEVDYCNDPSDAWPIIVNNFLSIENDGMFDDNPEGSLWRVTAPNGMHAHDANPLRAAMIVFLVIKEQP